MENQFVHVGYLKQYIEDNKGPGHRFRDAISYTPPPNDGLGRLVSRKGKTKSQVMKEIENDGLVPLPRVLKIMQQKD
jgi:hypothetical protein